MLRKIVILVCFVLFVPCMVFAAPEVKRYGNDGFTIKDAITDEFIAWIKAEKGQIKSGKLEFRVDNITDAELSLLCSTFPEMTYLNVAKGRQITTLEPLTKLKALRSLVLDDFVVRDMTPLAGLTGLEYIDIDCDFVMPDLKWMSGMTKLNNIRIENHGYQGGSLTSFEGLPNLPIKQIYFNGSGIKITDLTPLVNAMPNLQKLNLQNISLTDLTPLTKLANLSELYLYGAKLGDFTPLAKCAKLRILEYYAVKGADFSTLGKLTQVEEFAGGLTALDDISWMAQLPNLKKLRLFAEYVTDYSPLTKTNIKHLTIWQMKKPVGDLAFLGEMKSLTYLRLWMLQDVTNFEVIGSLPSLEELILMEVNSKTGEAIDLGFISKLQNLKTLDLTNNTKIAGLDNPKVLDGIKKLPKLTSLAVTKDTFTEEHLSGFPESVRIRK